MAGLLKAAMCLVLYVLVLVLSIVLFAVGVAMLPLRLVMSPRSFTRLYLYIADYYWKFAVWFGEFAGIQLTLYGDNVPLRENAFVISNHRWGVDFIVYWMLAARKGRLGCLKLMAKDWLKFFPGFGWGGYLLDFVFLKRDWQQDQSTIRETFHRLKTRDLPFWLLSHVEGTRLTPAKLEESKRFARERGLPVMEETLFPRVKVLPRSIFLFRCFSFNLFASFCLCQGFVSVIQELRDMKTPLVLYDTTLMYVDAKTGKTELPSGHPVPGPSTFSLFYSPSSHVHLHVKRYTMQDLPTTDAGLEKWLIDAFVRKQKLLSDFRITHKFPDPCPQPLMYPSMNIPL